MNWLFRAFLLVGAARRLAIDGDHVGWYPGQRCDPSDEALLEFFGVLPTESFSPQRPCMTFCP